MRRTSKPGRYRNAAKLAASRYDLMARTEGAILPAPRVKGAPRMKVTIPEAEQQAQMEDNVLAVGAACIRIPDAVLSAIKRSQDMPMWVKVFVSDYWRGLPDLNVLKPIQGTRFCLALPHELKREDGTMSPDQLRRQAELNTQVTYCLRDAEAMLAEFIRFHAWVERLIAQHIGEYGR